MSNSKPALAAVLSAQVKLSRLQSKTVTLLAGIQHWAEKGDKNIILKHLSASECAIETEFEGLERQLEDVKKKLQAESLLQTPKPPVPSRSLSCSKALPNPKTTPNEKLKVASSHAQKLILTEVRPL